MSPKNHERLIVGVDYGTTYTGVAFVSSSQTAKDVEVIRSWPGHARDQAETWNTAGPGRSTSGSRHQNHILQLLALGQCLSNCPSSNIFVKINIMSAPSHQVPRRPEIPQRISSLMSKQSQDRYTEAKSRKDERITTHANVSEFLEAKIKSLEATLDFDKAVKEGLLEVTDRSEDSTDECRQLLRSYIHAFAETNSELVVLKRQHRLVTDDLDMAAEKKTKTDIERDPGILQRAYRDSIVSRVMGATAKQRAQRFNGTAFAKQVRSYYGIQDSERCTAKESFCHVLGTFLDSALVKTAHIVPKSLKAQELAHLFGDQEVDVAYDPSNSLCLHRSIEELLDRGIIVIVPTIKNATPTAWRCVCLDDSKKNDIVTVLTDGLTRAIIRVDDLEKKDLTFLNENRPRRRFLYFRFLMSYFHAKANNISYGTNKIETTRFWPSGGAWLDKSVINELARCVSGCNPALKPENCFEGPESPESEDAGLRLSSQLLKDAYISSVSSREPDT